MNWTIHSPPLVPELRLSGWVGHPFKYSGFHMVGYWDTTLSLMAARERMHSIQWPWFGRHQRVWISGRIPIYRPPLITVGGNNPTGHKNMKEFFCWLSDGKDFPCFTPLFISLVSFYLKESEKVPTEIWEWGKSLFQDIKDIKNLR